MKKIDKNAYKESNFGRKHLITFAIIALIIALSLLGGGISLIVFGAISGVTIKIVWMVVVGSLLVILGIVTTIFALVILFTSASMIKVENGSVKDGNRAIGTVNVVKCDKCGEELPDNATFCSKCGTEIEGVNKCDCGMPNKKESDYCISCGKKLN